MFKSIINKIRGVFFTYSEATQVRFGRMQCKVLNDSGVAGALLGLGLSYGLTSEFLDVCNPKKDSPIRVPLDVYKKLINLAPVLIKKGGGHDKFLESITVHIYVKAPRYWWQEFDTYRVGVTKQSESTMHTILKRLLSPKDFMPGTDLQIIQLLNAGIERKDFSYVKKNLPESFLQGRVICTNYKALKNIIDQRKTHRLPEWQQFIIDIENSITSPDFIFTKEEGDGNGN